MRNESMRRSAGIRRRTFLGAGAVGAAALGGGAAVYHLLGRKPAAHETLIAKAASYEADLVSVIDGGLKELGVRPEELKGRRILLKPNLVEAHRGVSHINTHPSVVRAAADVFRRWGAGEVLVAEGPGHQRDTLLVLEESGYRDMLKEEKIRFVDLNYEEGFRVLNEHRQSRMPALILPSILEQVHWVVSMPKLKTHHWVGVTLSMKNFFGLMPGLYYGWPKNVLHYAGINESIVDINAAIRGNRLAIVDGIVGMQGDGPIMGEPKPAGVLAFGRNLTAVDATCARIMGIDPHKIPYLAAADGQLGAIAEKDIRQRGESIAAVQQEFKLLEKIPAQRGIRLSNSPVAKLAPAAPAETTPPQYITA